MQYGMVFDEKRQDDLAAEFHGVSVVVDPFSANYLRGSVIDFEDSLTGAVSKFPTRTHVSLAAAGNLSRPERRVMRRLKNAVPCDAERLFRR
jgi:capsule polysaccharide modification protein KpsS